MLEFVIPTIKQYLGISQEDTSFDMNIIMCVNSALSTLADIGLKEVEDVVLIDTSMTWDDLLGGRTDIEYAKIYIALKTKQLFDPPTSAAAIEALKQQLAEYEFRISTK